MAKGVRKLLPLSRGDAASLDDAFKNTQQGVSGEVKLVEAIATGWKAAVDPVVLPRMATNQPLFTGSSLIHSTPTVQPTASSGVGPWAQDPELGDLLLVTGYLRSGLVHRGRAVIFQAKTRSTGIPDHQKSLYEVWPPLRIVKPKLAPTWDVGPEGFAVPPSRRGAAYLEVGTGAVPQRCEAEAPRRHVKSLGECVRSMLRCRYSRAFTVVDWDDGAGDVNTWDQLVTFLLQRVPVLQPFVGLPGQSVSGRRITPRKGSGGDTQRPMQVAWVLAGEAPMDDADAIHDEAG